jgi:hypothetical protein
VFCDLFTVVRQALRISYDSYSIKSVRELFMRAEAELAGGEDAIVLYEQWIADRDPALLEQIERYNEEDCVSNLRLRDWLVERREEAEGSSSSADISPSPSTSGIRSISSRTWRTSTSAMSLRTRSRRSEWRLAGTGGR